MATPDLTGRKARCSYGAVRASDRGLPFFEFRGEGSDVATEWCSCGYRLGAHQYSYVQARCSNPAPRGPMEYDSYYCGHGG